MYTYWRQRYAQPLWNCWLLGLEALRKSHKANVIAILAFVYLFFLSGLKDSSSCGCLTQWPCDVFSSRRCKYPWFLKSARLRNTNDPFWWLLEMYSSDRARHSDADIIDRESGESRDVLPADTPRGCSSLVEEEEESFLLHQQKHEKIFFSDAAKEKEKYDAPPHRKMVSISDPVTHVASSISFYLSFRLLNPGADCSERASSTATRMSDTPNTAHRRKHLIKQVMWPSSFQAHSYHPSFHHPSASNASLTWNTYFKYVLFMINICFRDPGWEWICRFVCFVFQEGNAITLLQTDSKRGQINQRLCHMS